MVLSNQGDFYQIVSGMVDQRIAEHSIDGKTRNNSQGSTENVNRSKHHHQTGAGLKSQKVSKTKKRYHGGDRNRPDLAILKDNRGIFFQQSPSELLQSKGFSASSATSGENFSLAPPTKQLAHTEIHLNDRDSIANYQRLLNHDGMSNKVSHKEFVVKNSQTTA